MLLSTRWLRLVERNALVYRHVWPVLVAGLVEPFLYLLSIGYGIGGLVGSVQVGNQALPYAVFVAPALVATAAMNGAIYDTTFSVLHKLRYERIYDTMLTTSLSPRDIAVGEVSWAMVRGCIYTAAMLVITTAFGLTPLPWALSMLPAALLITFCFAAIGCAVTTFLRSWQDIENVYLVQTVIFLFSGTFLPVDRYPTAIRWLTELSPLTRGTDLLRGLNTGAPGVALSVVDVLFLAIIGVIGLRIAIRRLGRLILT
ncbi:ABC transporter permease [Kutzneria sp. NPDC052558]|uniref:ABC transporter permease n=1 Tax=Kutzneria sp. NPDC052558 TaxID=3364121 RepID=UPI0037CB2B2D